MIRAALLCLLAGPAIAQDLPAADIYIIGEDHGHGPHHDVQAELTGRVGPTAVIFEQLTDEQADRITPETPRDPQVMGQILDWDQSGWPDISFYLPIMAVSDAVILGAAGAPGDLDAYGLEDPLPPEQEATREALQQDAHCGALPPDRLPEFVARQRAVDAQFAARTLDALDRFGPPVVLITGNGHARPDWGVPAAIAHVRPEVRVHSILQDPAPPDPDAADPCDAFR